MPDKNAEDPRYGLLTATMNKREWFALIDKRSLLKNYGFPLFPVFLGLICRLSWIVYTHCTEEDAFITFRIAKNLAEGIGFVYNSGERVLGTTSPLFAILLAGWLAGISKNAILGARIFNLLASTAALIFLLLALRKSGVSKYQQTTILLIFALSAKLIILDVGGMETSLAIFLMLASWYFIVSGRIVWAGILLGLLFLTRLDLFLWPASVLLIELLIRPKNAVRMGIIIFLVNLPWIVFSLSYFGSPIPHTIEAKWVAYIQNDKSPLLTHLLAVANYMSPFSQYKEYIVLRNILAWMTLLIAAWQAAHVFKDKNFAPVVLFAVLDFSRLVFTRATFFNRYLAPLLVAVLILFGMGLGHLWEETRLSSLRTKSIYSLTLVALTAMGLVFGGYEVNQTKIKQEYRYDESLKKVGIWLQQYSLPSATVLAEPLGYIGYYSERYMIDEVGLVTPKVVALKRSGVSANEYFLIFKPDYFVLHCDDALKLQHKDGHGPDLAQSYTRRVAYNPLNYDVNQPDYSSFGALQRNSCYEVWQHNGE